VTDPLIALRGADIVVGYGRCVLEAMACGRTAFVFDRFGADGWVTEASYPEIESAGFSGSTDGDAPGFRDWERMLDTYDCHDGAVGHDLARRRHDARAHAVSVVELLEDLGPVDRADPHLSFTLGRVWREQWRWEGKALAWAAEVDRVRADLHASEAQLLAAEQALAMAVQERDATARALDDVLGSRSYRWARRIAGLRPRRELNREQKPD
jgi:hypothetical protein